MKTRTEPGRMGWIGVAWMFGLVGPAFGGVTAIAAALAILPSVPLGMRAPGDILLALFLTYALGLTPAVFTGLICGMASPAMRKPLSWLGFCAFVGASVSFVGLLIALSAIAPGGWRNTTSLDFDIFVAFALIGGVAGVGSGWVVRNRRPVAHQPTPAATMRLVGSAGE